MEITYLGYSSVIKHIARFAVFFGTNITPNAVCGNIEKIKNKTAYILLWAVSTMSLDKAEMISKNCNSKLNDWACSVIRPIWSGYKSTGMLGRESIQYIKAQSANWIDTVHYHCIRRYFLEQSYPKVQVQCIGKKNNNTGDISVKGDVDRFFEVNSLLVLNYCL